MSTLIVYANNASSTLASGIGSSDTTLSVNIGDGALFPTISAGQIAVVTLEDASGNIEIVHATARTSDTMTIVRAQEGTDPAAFASGSRVELRVTAGILAALLQKTGSDTLSGTTTFSGVLAMGSAGSIQGGELAGVALRGAAGETDNQILIPSGGGAPTAGGSVILTSANLTGNLPSGVGAVLTGMVLFWSGTSGTIPSGFLLCDGTHGTPDLRDQFIVGGGGSLPSTGGANTGATAAAGTGITIAGTALTSDQMPAHSHEFWSGVAASGNSAGKCPDWAAGGAFNATITAGPYVGQQIIQNTGGGAVHTHTVTDPTHAHSITLPPYRAVFAIMKT